MRFPAVRSAWTLLALLMLCVAASRALYGWGHGDAVLLELSFSAAADAPLVSVNAIAGADRFTWNVVQPGESVSVELHPDGEPVDLHLSFVLKDLRVGWRGAYLGKGDGYRMHVEIDETGRVRERRCRLPCAGWQLR